MSDLTLPLERGIGGFEPRGNLDRTMWIEWPRRRRRRLITAGAALAVAVAGAFGAAAFFGHAKPHVGRITPQPPGLHKNGVIAFVKTVGPRQEIHTVNPDGTGLRNIESTLRPGTSRLWSPDGTQVALLHKSRTRSATEKIEFRRDLYVMNADGMGARRIRSCRGQCTQDLAWSPDGSKIAFIAGVYSDAPLEVVNADGTGLRVLCSGFRECGQGLASPQWSPDGSKITFSNAGVAYFSTPGPVFPSSIHVVNTDGTGLRKLTNLHCGSKTIFSCPFYDSDPVWSPDGTQVAFTRRPAGVHPETGPSGLMVMNPDGSGLRILPTCPSQSCSESSPQWSPDGKLIASVELTAVERGSENTVIRVARADGSSSRTMRACLNGSCLSPEELVWSPDGMSLSFLVGEDPGPTYSLYVISSDGGGLRLIVPHADGYVLAWLPAS
jgi:hypothetical protein